MGDRTVEASDYVAELKQEAARLKNELATYAQSSGQNSLAAIGQYIASPSTPSSGIYSCRR